MSVLLLLVGFLTGAVCVGLPLFCGVLWWMRRCERVTDQRDSLALQLANAVLELRTAGAIEFMIEGDVLDDDEQGDG